MNFNDSATNGVRSFILFVLVFALAGGISVIGFFYGYSEGWDHSQIEAQRHDPFFVSRDVSNDSVISYFHFFRFRFSSLGVWLIISFGCLLMMRRKLSFAECAMLIGSALNVVFYVIVLFAESGEFWNTGFDWNSRLGRLAKISQVLAHCSSLLFAFSLIWKELHHKVPD